MKLILEKLSPKNIEKELKELLIKHRSKQKLFTGEDYGKYNRLCRLNEIKRSYVRRETIFTYILLWIFSIIVIASGYISLYIINYFLTR